MSNFKFNPSSAFIVKPDTPLSDCVNAMKKHGFGAVLVSDPASGAPTGIFTERDVIKWIDLIQNGGYWGKPVFLLMSKPLIWITLEEIDQAPKIMVQNKIRHLPVVHTEESGEVVMSMISMRDIVRNNLRREERAKSQALPHSITVGMIAKSKGMRTLIRKICAQQGNAQVDAVEVDSAGVPETQLDNYSHVIFDLDHFPPIQWTAILKELNAKSGHPEVILVYDPDLHNEQELQVLSKLGLSSRFTAFMKPLNVWVILSHLL